MTSKELARAIGCSQVWIFQLKKKFPDRCPDNFDDIEGWKGMLEFSRTKARVKYVRGATQPDKGNGDGENLSDIARLTRNRADKVHLENTILTIEVEATRRQVVRQEEVVAIFAQLATVVRGRLMKMKNDLPSALLGLDAPAIDKVVGDKMEHVLSSFRLPEDFFNSKGLV